MNPTFTAYWLIVLNTLVQICKLPAKEARLRVRDFRRDLQAAPADYRQDMVYHLEPLALAWQLSRAKQTRLKPDQIRLYDRIVQEAVEEASVVGSEEEVSVYQPA